MTTLAVMASQTLPWPGKRALRAAIAAQEAVPPQERLERARLSVAAAVKRAYWRLALARESLLLARRAGAGLEGGRRRRPRALRRGAGRPAGRAARAGRDDALRAGARAAGGRARRARRGAEPAARPRAAGRGARDGAASRSRTKPSRADRRSGPRPRRRAPSCAPPPRRWSASGWPSALARRDFRPDLTVQASYMNRGGLDPMWQAGLGVNLPVFRARRRAAALAEAEARGRSAARQLEAVRAQLRYRTQERLAQLRGRGEDGAALRRRASCPRRASPTRRRIASYQVGRAPFLAVLEALSSLYADRLARARRARRPRADPGRARGGEPRGDERAALGRGSARWRGGYQ